MGELSLPSGENRPEVGIRRDHDAAFVEGPREDFLVARRMHPVRSDMDCVKSRQQEKFGRRGGSAFSIGNFKLSTEGEFPLHRRSRREAQALADVFRPEVRVFGDDLTFCQPACQQPQHRGDWNPQMAHTHTPPISTVIRVKFFIGASCIASSAGLLERRAWTRSSKGHLRFTC
jgi:hypothetical protein